MLADTGCDVQATVALKYGRDKCASVTYTLLGQTGEETTYVGTKGSIKIHSPGAWLRVTVLERTCAVDVVSNDVRVGVCSGSDVSNNRIATTLSVRADLAPHLPAWSEFKWLTK